MTFENLKKKQLVFTVATGRCGTAFLAEILRLVPGAISCHEPNPEYAEVLRKVQGHPKLAREFLIERKLPVIDQEDSPIYIETSHLFCKGFLEPLIELDIVPAIIWMKRAHRDVAASMYRGGTIPGRTEKGLCFYLDPSDFGTLPLKNSDKLHDYQLCYWYCLEIERRATEYRTLYSNNGWKWGETSIGEITKRGGLRQLLEDLGLPGLPWYTWLRYFNNRRRKVNPTSKLKQQVELPDTLDEMEAEVRDQVEAFKIQTKVIKE